MNSQEITKAIGAHGKWKQRLSSAIEDGQSDITPERVAPDNLCEFGRWLHSLPAAEQRGESFANVRALHAAFHKEAADVLKLALGGDKVAAGKCMALGGNFSDVSAKLTGAMMDWKKKLDM